MARSDGHPHRSSAHTRRRIASRFNGAFQRLRVTQSRYVSADSHLSSSRFNRIITGESIALMCLRGCHDSEPRVRILQNTAALFIMRTGIHRDPKKSQSRQILHYLRQCSFTGMLNRKFSDTTS